MFAKGSSDLVMSAPTHNGGRLKVQKVSPHDALVPQ